jgi:muramoyltetrapeptide carboxypeptidase LdcA involved in peptidoglycan recycling
MLFPEKLKIGDTIGIFSPSSPATVTAKNRFARAKNYLQGKGFKIAEGSLTGKNDFYRSGSIQCRANELNELIRNPDVKCIMSVIGGQNSSSILPYIDYNTLAKNPKIIVGYSDVTAILLGIYSKIGLITFYGPALVASFGEIGYFVNETFRYLSETLLQPNIPYLPNNPTFWSDEYIDWETQQTEKQKIKNKLITVNDGTTKGKLIVGNLNTILGIYGSEYMPKIENGDILVIEDSLKNASVIERLFSHLKLNGVFDKIGGLVLGKHEKFDDCKSGRKPYEIMMEVIGNTSIPILAEYDCCHTHPMITLPIGIQAELDATSQQITLLEKWWRS